jgi:hypothetical protein
LKSGAKGEWRMESGEWQVDKREMKEEKSLRGSEVRGDMK